MLLETGNFRTRVQYGRMISAPEVSCDIEQRDFGQLAAEKHGNLPRQNDNPSAFLRSQRTHPETKMLGDDLLNTRHGHGAAGHGQSLFESLGGNVLVNGLGNERRMRHHPYQTILQFSNVL